MELQNQYPGDSQNSFLHAMTNAERRHLQTVRESDLRYEVVDVGQNPLKRLVCSRRGRLPTLMSGIGSCVAPGSLGALIGWLVDWLDWLVKACSVAWRRWGMGPRVRALSLGLRGFGASGRSEFRGFGLGAWGLWGFGSVFWCSSQICCGDSRGPGTPLALESYVRAPRSPMRLDDGPGGYSRWMLGGTAAPLDDGQGAVARHGLPRGPIGRVRRGGCGD
eukprot:4972065-Pyramimonas_sp.AAC.1